MARHKTSHMLNIHWIYVDDATATDAAAASAASADDIDIFDTHTNGTIAISFVCVYDRNSLAVEQQRVGSTKKKKQQQQKPNNFILYSVCRIFSYSLRLFIFVCFFVFARFNFNTKRERDFCFNLLLFLQTYIDVLFIQHQNWSGRGQSYSLFTVNDGINIIKRHAQRRKKRFRRNASWRKTQNRWPKTEEEI